MVLKRMNTMNVKLHALTLVSSLFTAELVVLFGKGKINPHERKIGYMSIMHRK